MIIQNFGLGLSDLFISNKFVGSIFINSGWSLALNNFGAYITGTNYATCYVRFDWDIEKFFDTYGKFSKFGGTVSFSSNSWQTCENARIICYEKRDENFVEVLNKLLAQVSDTASKNVNFEVDLNELENVCLVRFEIASWCTNGGYPGNRGYWKNLYFEE